MFGLYNVLKKNPVTQVDIFTLPVSSEQQSKTQRYYVYLKEAK